MSIAVCTLCTRPVDTDFDTDGLWDGTDFYCAACMEAPSVERKRDLGNEGRHSATSTRLTE